MTSISVVIPTHNRPSGLARLLRSIDPERVEVIVVDDGSDPPVEPANERIRVLRNETPQLVSQARNLGAQHASGDVLIFIDDDCVVVGEALDKLADRASRVGFAGAVIVYMNDSDVIWCAGVTRRVWSGRTVLRATGEAVEHAAALVAVCDDFPSVMALARRTFDLVDGFDAMTFPMCLEEADLGARIFAMGGTAELVADAIVEHDIDQRNLLQRLHLESTERAYLMARGRGMFIRRHTASRLRRTSRLLFWTCVLAPAYVVAILLSAVGTRQRLTTVARFLAGTWSGLRTPLTRD